MKILVISDQESRSLWDYYNPSKLEGVDLILSCGDLDHRYLEFLVTMVNRPLFYVHGNHDESYDENPPEGCVCLDDQLVLWKGIRIMGLGGSHRYRRGKYMFTESQMEARIRKLWLWLKYYKGVDIILTHSPIRGVNDENNLTHRGFKCFDGLIEKYHPKYFIHGHIHMNYGLKIPRRMEYKGTTVINGYESYIFEYDS